MTTFFVSRHAGAVDWLAQQGFVAERTVPHLNLAEIGAGDIVIGTLPAHLAADICALGARYVNLSLHLPADKRGVELTAADLTAYGAKLEELQVQKVISPTLPELETPSTRADTGNKP